MSHMVALRDVTRVYNKGRPNEVRPVDGVSLRIGRGEMAVLKGPSGSGKTTLLALIGCMSRPTAGSILVAGRDVAKLPERFLTQVRRETFGFIFQQLHLIQGIDVLENIMLPLYPLDTGFDVAKQRADALTERLGLAPRRRFKVDDLSGGERQRVAIARALINEPEAILADEPTAHLDGGLSGELMEIFGDLRGRGKTIVIATHDPLVYESPLVDRVVSMHNGRIVGEGTG